MFAGGGPEEGPEIMEDDDSSDQSVNELYSNKPVVHSETLKIALSQLLDMYIDEEYFNLGREIGKLLRWGELDALGILNNAPDEYQIADTPGSDIFGNPLSKKYNFECECPKCHRTLAASRFAPHLEKCMGMGRNSSRIASRRLAAASSNSNNNNNNNAPNNSASDSAKNVAQGNTTGGQGPNPLNGELGSEDDHFEEDDDDEDWSLDRKKKSKRGNEKVTVKRKGPLSRVRNADGVGPKGRRGVSPSVTDSPASLGAVESSIHDEDDSTHMSLP